MLSGLNINTNVEGLDALKSQIEYIDKLKSMQTDKSFQQYIKDKCFKTLEKVMNARLVDGTTTNDDSISLYRDSNHIIDTDDGFIIYNDAKVDANVVGVQNSASNYPNGEFSIALAFEYGVGIVGPETGNPNAWNYNVNNYNFGWVLPKNVLGTSGVIYAGYKGFEIYRYTAEEIQTNLSKWVKEYKKDRGVSQ